MSKGPEVQRGLGDSIQDNKYADELKQRRKSVSRSVRASRARLRTHWAFFREEGDTYEGPEEELDRLLQEDPIFPGLRAVCSSQVGPLMQSREF